MAARDLTFLQRPIEGAPSFADDFFERKNPSASGPTLRKEREGWGSRFCG